MRTNIVYTIISRDEDYYTEQLLASAWSAKYYNPDAKIILLCDETTNRYIEQKYSNIIQDIINDIKVVDVPAEFGLKEQSRWLKTSAREYVSGPMIQVDTDTIVCEKLSEVDNIRSDISAVCDYHCSMDSAPYRNKVLSNVCKLYELSADEVKKSGANYYNSGIIFSNDTDKARKFYRDWHKFWKVGLDKGVPRDQYAFFRAAMDNSVDRLDDVYNCMIRTSVKYLHTAKIIHFFNSGWGSDQISPFFSNEIYRRIKEYGSISESDKKLILNCKSEFSSPSVIMDSFESEVIFSPVFILLRVWHKDKSIMFKFANYLSRAILKLKGL
ncbi:hypothetical protein SAMN04487928_1298 [Butyrivibrio proteoclasticus]|uniref:Glycosyl transferase GT8 family n=1 Tax=Butyrivibrio proteoclasticus TaxID=43305 RepID=A0A1I5X8E3_9FIRM|nr:hypothetical protein SAMN04487928_1298 [Butyrivibrio proteoclasticus]